MLVSTTTEIVLQKSYDKVTHVYPTFKNSFALLARRNTGHDVFVHCNKNGKILMEEVFQDPVGSLALVSDHEAVVLLTRRNLIRWIDLRSQQKTDIKFYYLFEEHDQVDILTFNVSRMFCVTQHGLHGDHRLKLSYFCYPLTANAKPAGIYESKEDEWTTESRISKGNEESLVLWWRGRQSNEIQIRSCRVNTQAVHQIQFQVNTVSLNYRGEELKIQYAIERCWQLQAGKYIIFGISANVESLKTSETSKKPMVLQLQKGVLRQSRIALPRGLEHYQVEQMAFGIGGVLRSFRFQNGHVQPAPVLYFNNLNEQVIEERNWECDHRLKCFVSGYERDTIIECEYQNNDVHEIVVTKRHMPNARMLALHYLLQLNADFDDDLLQEAVECLPLYGFGTE